MTDATEPGRAPGPDQDPERSDQDEPSDDTIDAADDAADAGDEAARKRRLAQVFGEVLPEATQDERSGAWGDREAGTDDDWFRRQVPPHHG